MLACYYTVIALGKLKSLLDLCNHYFDHSNQNLNDMGVKKDALAPEESDLSDYMELTETQCTSYNPFQTLCFQHTLS